MNQPEQTNVSGKMDALQVTPFSENGAETAIDAGNTSIREWLPEDEDDWYEPDCCRTDRGS